MLLQDSDRRLGAVRSPRFRLRVAALHRGRREGLRLYAWPAGPDGRVQTSCVSRGVWIRTPTCAPRPTACFLACGLAAPGRLT